MTILSLQEYTDKINTLIPNIDIEAYAHNIISLTLCSVEKHYGTNEVLNIIRNTELKNKGWGYMLDKLE